MNASDRKSSEGAFSAASYRRASAQGLRSAYTMHRPFSLSALLDDWTEWMAPCVWQAHVGLNLGNQEKRAPWVKPPIYTPEERRRRDSTPWTTVQAVLAPLQFVAFAISLVLVIRFLKTGEGYGLATGSILIKTFLLYAIMITGSIWEKIVFGKWLFAKSFFWEDVFSLLVLILQTAYLASLIFGWGTPRQQMLITIAAYSVYVINASQFLLKLWAARLEGAGTMGLSPSETGQVT